MVTRTIKKVHLTSMNDILKNIAMRKYMIQYCRENEGFISINYRCNGNHGSADLTSSYIMKNAEIPDDCIVNLDVQGKESEKIIDFLIRNLDGVTLVE